MRRREPATRPATTNAAGDPELRDAERAERRTDRSGEVERHRVEGDRRGDLVRGHELRDERLLRRRRVGADDAEAEREEDDQGGRRERGPRERRDRDAEPDGDRLRDEQQPPAVEAVGRAPGPRDERQDRDELAKVEHAEQERRVRLPVDEQRGGEVLEPGAARGERVAGEVR
jgi:hypothetical protein